VAFCTAPLYNGFMINFCIYEDEGYLQLDPLTTIRPAYCLQTGSMRLLDRFQRFFQHGNISLHCRDYLKYELANQVDRLTINQLNTGSPCLFVNGRVVMTDALAEMIISEDTSQNFLLTYQGQVVAMYLRADQLGAMKTLLNKIPSNEALIKTFRAACRTKELDDCTVINYPWDLISVHAAALESDFAGITRKGLIKGTMGNLSVLYNDANMFIGSDVECEDFVVLDARKGPIIIGKNVTIKGHSRLEGPLFLAEGVTVQAGSTLTNVSIGKHCKIGGEVSSSIFHSYSNKSHSGFCGHSVIGEWVNMGANTTISNLKNNYDTVRMGPDKIDTGLQFCGAMVGDHVKLGIGTLMNCGSRIGFGSSLMGTTVHHGDIPAFSWGEAPQYDAHKLDKFLVTADRMSVRRGISFGDRFKELIGLLYKAKRG